jgi:hypothetical protein
MKNIIKRLLPILLLTIVGITLSFPGLVISKGGLQVTYRESLNQLEQVSVKKQIEQKQTPQTWQEEFEDKIDHWISQISKQDTQFSDWKDSTWESYPFGPGSRKWIVVIERDQYEIGYIILEEARSGNLNLIEYGKMEDPIFSKVIKDMENQEKDFIYSGLFLAEKKGEVLVDLITGESYDHVPVEKVKTFWVAEDVSDLERAYRLIQTEEEPITQYTEDIGKENGNQDTLENTQKNIQSMIDDKASYSYQATIVENVKALYKVLSVHQWNRSNTNDYSSAPEVLFVGIEDNGIRYLSADYLFQLDGSFY